MAENQGKEVSESVQGREIRLGKHNETQREDVMIYLFEEMAGILPTHTPTVLEAKSKDSPGTSPSKPQIQDRAAPDNGICLCLFKA